MLTLAALAHRPDSEDCYSLTDNTVQLRLATAIGEVARVTVLFGDPYWQTATGEARYHEAPLAAVGDGQTHTYWQATVTVPYRRLRYLFAVYGHDGSRVLFGDRGPRADDARERQTAENYYHLPYLHAIDRVTTPAWVSETVWYQIFPERFANGDATNDPRGTLPWRPDTHPSRTDFYGGDLQGVLDHLDDLAALGVNGLYFCPVLQAPSNHKYDTTDYYRIDAAFGDQALFTRLVAAAHARGMRVMLDAVFNHLGVTAKQWQDVLAKGPASPYVDWFHIHEWPLTPYHDPLAEKGAPQYDTFGFEPTMPKLNTANPAVQDYLIDVATYWVRQCDIDAWRLDVANEIDHHFWRRLHAALMAVRPDCYIVGEVWHSSQPWLGGAEFTGAMNYAFTQPIIAHFVTEELTAEALCAQLVDQLQLYRDPVNQAMLNVLDSHDTPRLLTLANGDERRVLQALAFTMLQTGAPCLYYGTEMGMTGGADPDNRKPMDWTQLHAPLWQSVAALVHLRRLHAALLGRGSTRLLVQADGLLRVTRRLDDAELTGWFNATDKPVALAQAPGGQLAARGFTIVETDT